MELQDWRKEPRKNYSNEFKLRMVELASQPGACVAQIARENGVNDNVIFKWLRLWQNEGRVSRRLPVTTSSDTGVELLPVEITPDEQKEPVAAIAPSLSTSTQTRVSASSCTVSYTHLRAHETDSYLVCRLLLEKKKFFIVFCCIFAHNLF